VITIIISKFLANFKLISRIQELIADFCGVLTEDAIKENLPLIYEILDEVLVIHLNLHAQAYCGLGLRLSSNHFHGNHKIIYSR
jgi:hypothetical protein